jgi:hypothetical protein
MSYYSRNSYSSDGSWFTIILCFVLVFAIMFGVNSCSSTTWNDGVCPDCEVRYELRGVSKGLKYYSCPGCGQEVQRYGS